jgi:hypothetical protein
VRHPRLAIADEHVDSLLVTSVVDEIVAERCKGNEPAVSADLGTEGIAPTDVARRIDVNTLHGSRLAVEDIDVPENVELGMGDDEGLST